MKNTNSFGFNLEKYIKNVKPNLFEKKKKKKIENENGKHSRKQYMLFVLHITVNNNTLTRDH
jgi:hypothetical protein